jgi:hypothetical protein
VQHNSESRRSIFATSVGSRVGNTSIAAKQADGTVVLFTVMLRNNALLARVAAQMGLTKCSPKTHWTNTPHVVGVSPPRSSFTPRRRYSGALASLALSSGAILGTRGINAVPSMARYWVFLLLHVLPVHLSRKLFSDSAGGETFTCRLRPFAGGSSWQRLIALPIAHADPKHRERSAATATRGRLAASFVAAVVCAKLPCRRPRPRAREGNLQCQD